MKIVQFLRPLTLLVHLRPNFFHPLDLGRQISNGPPPSYPNDNQSVKFICLFNTDLRLDFHIR